MNFSTDLPKSKPLVTYIVASTMKSADVFPDNSKDLPCFRMHAVVLKFKGTLFKHGIESQMKLNNGKGLILCHLRKIDPTENISMEPLKETEVNKEQLQTEHKEHVNSPQTPNINVLIVQSPNEVGKFSKSKELIKAINECKGQLYIEMYGRLNKIEEHKD